MAWLSAKLLGSLLRDYDRDVAGPLENLVHGAARARPPALERAALVGPAARDDQLVGVHVEVVLGVGHGRTHGGGHGPGSAMRQELEDRQRLARWLATHHVQHQPHLLRRHTNVAKAGA